MNLPVGDLINTIGLKLALELVEERGGRRVYIPTPARVTENCPLACIVGLAAALALAAKWPGEWTAIPLAKAYVRRLRARDIVTRYAHTTAAALASEYNITERWVLSIVAAGMPKMPELERAASPQLGLFE